MGLTQKHLSATQSTPRPRHSWIHCSRAHRCGSVSPVGRSDTGEADLNVEITAERTPRQGLARKAKDPAPHGIDIDR
jgi:hypothetical protein